MSDMVKIGYWDPVNQRIVPQPAVPASPTPTPTQQASRPGLGALPSAAGARPASGGRVLQFPQRPSLPLGAEAVGLAWVLPPENALGAPVVLPRVQPAWLPSTWRIAQVRPILREVTILPGLPAVECGGGTEPCSLVARAGNTLVAFEKVRRPGEFRYGLAIGLAENSARARIVSLLADGVPLTGSVNSPSRTFRVLDVERQTIAPDPPPVRTPR